MRRSLAGPGVRQLRGPLCAAGEATQCQTRPPCRLRLSRKPGMVSSICEFSDTPCSPSRSGALARASARRRSRAAGAQAIVVYKTATCGCCTKWVDHLKAAGFAPTVHTSQTMTSRRSASACRSPAFLPHRDARGLPRRRTRACGRNPAAAAREAARGGDRGAGHAGRLAGDGVEPPRALRRRRVRREREDGGRFQRRRADRQLEAGSW